MVDVLLLEIKSTRNRVRLEFRSQFGIYQHAWDRLPLRHRVCVVVVLYILLHAEHLGILSELEIGGIDILHRRESKLVSFSSALALS